VAAAAAGASGGRLFAGLIVSPAGIESRPLLLATISLVITGVLDALRFVRLASATSGESSADATAAMSRSRGIILRMRRMVAKFDAGCTSAGSMKDEHVIHSPHRKQRVHRARVYIARMKITPVLIVPAIEPVLPLWEALGFTRAAEVPHGDALGFVILAGNGAELMYQTVDSVRDDEPRALEGHGATLLFIEVD